MNMQGFSKKAKGEFGMNITFRSVTDKEEQNGWNWGSYIRSIGSVATNPMEMPLTYGRLLKLFGEPAFTSENLEDMYNYLILGTDEEGNTYQLVAYSGPSGPAIGGDSSNPKLAEVAAALDEYINASDYVDFDYTGIYEDYDVEVKMGIQNGEPYMEENEMEDIDFEEML